jgi:DNA-nicking Smr family endonuclease
MEPTRIPIDGVLDLHAFAPADVKVVLLEYLAECGRRRIPEVRVIHGKGRGELRRTVHHLLARHPAVVSCALASPAYGGDGATLVRLRLEPAVEPAQIPGQTPPA